MVYMEHDEQQRKAAAAGEHQNTRTPEDKTRRR
jgi:hypothetical protein